MKELWKPVPDSIYEASNLGRIRSINRTSVYYCPRSNKLKSARFKGKVRKLYLNTRLNYYEISVVKVGRPNWPKMKKVHRMVAEAFIKNPLNLPQINHKDGNRLNNSVKNLEWCTAEENMNHAFETGLIPGTIPTKVIDDIITNYKPNQRTGYIAARYNISTDTVRRVVRGTYKKYRKRCIQLTGKPTLMSYT